MSVTVDCMSQNKTNTLRFPILLPCPKILTSNHPHLCSISDRVKMRPQDYMNMGNTY